jgi:glutamyl-Q tRNA(Asp) synthetase
MEDIDTPRVVAGAAARIAADLLALGLSFDGPMLVQSEHQPRYAAALDVLMQRGLLYACRCSRKDIERAASAPHAGEEGAPYPGTCRTLGLPFDDAKLPVALRVRVPNVDITVVDALQGPFTQNLARDVGDFVLKRKDGLFAYQLCVVVDDAHQHITEVVRGRDLLTSAPRQVFLAEALGHTAPRFAHLPLWLDASGVRLSKRSPQAPALLRTLLNDEGPSGVLGRMGAALGLCAPGQTLSLVALTDALDDRLFKTPTIRAAVPDVT